MKHREQFNKYSKSIFNLLLNTDENLFKKSINLIKKTQKKKGKVYIVGNGGSASIASHVSVDFAKVARVKSSTFNNANLITCFANDMAFLKLLNLNFLKIISWLSLTDHSLSSDKNLLISWKSNLGVFPLHGSHFPEDRVLFIKSGALLI